MLYKTFMGFYIQIFQDGLDLFDHFLDWDPLIFEGGMCELKGGHKLFK